MSIARFFTWWATLGPIGYLPAPGTVASIISLPFIVGLQSYFSSIYSYNLIIIVCIVFGFFAIKIALEESKWHHDPSQIVFDELIGMMIMLSGIPVTTASLLLGIIIFRVLDITKIAGIRHCEQLHGAGGIILDDVMAGLLSNIILRIIL